MDRTAPIYKNDYFVVEIAEPDRIVISHPDPAHEFQLIVTLAEAGENKAQLTWRQVFSSREHFDQVKSFVVEANEQVLDRLEAEVARIRRLCEGSTRDSSPNH